MSLPALIYDRTLADIRKAKNHAAPAPAKAFWNAADLNRVQDWTAYLVRALAAQGYHVTGYVSPGRTWRMTDIPTRAQIDRLRANVDALRAAFFQVPSWREILYRNTVDFEQANALEWDLQQVKDWLESMIKAFELRQAGTIFMIAGGILHEG